MTILGIPSKLLHEAIGHTVSVETKDGTIYRGHLMSAEDYMNVLLEGVTVLSQGFHVSSGLGPQTGRFSVAGPGGNCGGNNFGGYGGSHGDGTAAPAEQNIAGKGHATARAGGCQGFGNGGGITVVEQVYLRGSSVRHFVLPEALYNSPMFGARGQGYGRGGTMTEKGGKKGFGKGKKGKK